MTLQLPIPHKPIQDAIQMEGVTAEMILRVKEEQAALLRAEEYFMESSFQKHFKAADLGISSSKLTALRSAVRVYLQAEKSLEEEPHDIARLITVGALEPNLWNRVLGEKHNRSVEDLDDLINKGEKIQKFHFRDMFEIVKVLRAFSFDVEQPEKWTAFCRSAVDSTVKPSSLKILSYLGPKAFDAFNWFILDRPLSEIRERLGLTTDDYAAAAVMVGLRWNLATGGWGAKLGYGDQRFIDAYNRRFTVSDGVMAREIFTDEALQEFNEDPHRRAYARIARGDVQDLKIV